MLTFFFGQNPDYYEVENPSDLSPITGLAIEIWSVDGVSAVSFVRSWFDSDCVEWVLPRLVFEYMPI